MNRKNYLTSLPDSIGNLFALRNLYLDSNQLHSLPNSITSLPSNCLIYLENAGLSMSVLNRLREICTKAGYNGPRINFSIRENRRNIQRNTTIQDVFSSICSKAGISEYRNFEQTYPNLQIYMSENNTSEALISWLSRMSYMKDSQREGETGLFTTILSHLDLAERNEEFRHSFFTIIDGASATCGDRMTLSVLHLGIANKSLTLDKTDLKGFADFLIHGPWMLDQLEHIARAKIPTLRFVDEIEVYLAYPVKLKERLNLQIDVEEMLYFGCSGVTQQDLDNAANHIKGVLSETDAIANILIKRDDWIETLEKHTQTAKAMATFKRMRDTRNAEMEEAGVYNPKKVTEIQRDYEASLISLTNKILRSKK